MVNPFKCSYVNDVTETESRFGPSPESSVFTFFYGFFFLFTVSGLFNDVTTRLV